MGYYTDYELTYEPDDFVDEIDEALDKLGYSDLAAGHSMNMKWYNHERDMTELSKEFPDTVFILHGVGEEPGDMWKKRFVNGEMEEVRAEIVFPDFPPLPPNIG